METKDLTIRARSIARCLSYNDDEHQAAAKHTLLEMAHRLDTQDVRVHAKADGLLLINGLGKSRYASFKETLLYRVFGVVPKVV